jgi:hypothetical protein
MKERAQFALEAGAEGGLVGIMLTIVVAGASRPGLGMLRPVARSPRAKVLHL